MTHKDYSEHLVSLARVLFPKQVERVPFHIWWEKLCNRCGVMMISELGENHTWGELITIHGYLLEQADKQLQERVAELPDRDGRQVLASPIESADRRKTPLTEAEQVAAAHVHAKLQQFEDKEAKPA